MPESAILLEHSPYWRLEITETKALPHIAIALSTVDVSAVLLMELRKLTGASFSELKGCIAPQQPVILIPMFDNAFYHGGAAMLRAVVDLLESNGVAFAVYELAEGERFEARDENLSRITSDTLKNILREATREAEAPRS